jgi:hypothetical protein
MDLSARIEIEERRASGHPSSDIFVVKGTTGKDDGFKVLLRLMGDNGLRFYRSEKEGTTSGPDGLIPSDAVVIVKVNSQWDERGGTNTDLVRSIIEAVLDHPDVFVGEVVVADNGQAQYGSTRRGGSLDYERNNAEDRGQSIQRVVDGFSDAARVSTYLWDAITTNQVSEYFMGDDEDGYVVDEEGGGGSNLRVSYPKFRTRYGTRISFRHGVWRPDVSAYDAERLKVINVPVLKAHFIYGVTGCVKHYMGVVSDKLTGGDSHRSVGRGGMGTVMAGTRMPALNVLDAIWVNAIPGKGPSSPYGEATRLNVVAAGTDPIALDYWASKEVLMEAARLKGHRGLSRIDPDNTAPKSFGSWLRLSAEEVVAAGHAVTLDEDRINVYVREL